MSCQTSDAAFIPAGWDSKRLIDGLLSPDKTPWGPSATFAEVVVAPTEAARRGSTVDGVSGDGTGGAALGAEEEMEVVESEEVWLTNLGKQVAGADGRSRWPSAIAAASKVVKASKVRNFIKVQSQWIVRCSEEELKIHSYHSRPGIIAFPMFCVDTTVLKDIYSWICACFASPTFV